MGRTRHANKTNHLTALTLRHSLIEEIWERRNKNLNHGWSKVKVIFSLKYSWELSIDSFGIQKYTQSPDNKGTTPKTNMFWPTKSYVLSRDFKADYKMGLTFPKENYQPGNCGQERQWAGESAVDLLLRRHEPPEPRAPPMIYFQVQTVQYHISLLLVKTNQCNIKFTKQTLM